MLPKSNNLRLVSYGNLPVNLKHLCLQLDENLVGCNSVSQFFDIASEISKYSAILLISIEIDESLALHISKCESHLPEPICLGFLVSDDHEFIAFQLKKLLVSSNEPISKESASFAGGDYRRSGVSSLFKRNFSHLSNQNLDQIFKSQFGLLVFCGHSNGVCHGSGDIALCIRDQHLGFPKEANYLQCFDGGACRFDFNTDYLRVDADKISSQVIIDFTCFGYMISDNLLSARHSLGRYLLFDSGLRALVTSVRPLRINLDAYNLAIFMAHDAIPMGYFSGLLNRYLAITDPYAAELLCFGDPRARLKTRIPSSGETLDEKLSIKCDVKDVEPTSFSFHSDWSEQDVLICDNMIAGAWSPSGKGYLLIDNSSDRVIVQRVKLKSLQNALKFEVFVPHLIFLEAYISSMLSAISSSHQQVSTQVFAEAEHVRSRFLEFLLSFDSVSYLVPASVLSRHSASAILSKFHQYLMRISRLLNELHVVASISPDLCFHSGQQVLHGARARNSLSECPDCCSRSVLFNKSMVGINYTRKALFCDRCGPIYDGFGLISAFSLEIYRAESLKIAMSIKNPFGFSMPLSLLITLISFDGQSNRDEIPDPATIEAKSEYNFSAGFVLPNDLPKGVHRIRLILSLGPHVEMMSRAFPYHA